MVRGLVVVGALIGLTACQSTHKKHHNTHKKHYQEDESSISDDESESSEIEVIEDVYGPPVDEVETVYGPPSYFDDIEGKPDLIDEPMPSKEVKNVK